MCEFAAPKKEVVVGVSFALFAFLKTQFKWAGKISWVLSQIHLVAKESKNRHGNRYPLRGLRYLRGVKRWSPASQRVHPATDCGSVPALPLPGPWLGTLLRAETPLPWPRAGTAFSSLGPRVRAAGWVVHKGLRPRYVAQTKLFEEHVKPSIYAAPAGSFCLQQPPAPFPSPVCCLGYSKCFISARIN